MDKLIISKDFIFSQLSGNFEDIVKIVSDKLVGMHIVKESYPEAVISREKEYPTGLMGKFGGFAIPHTYCEHCNRSALTVIRPEMPLRFTRMDDHSDTVDCGLIIMLAIANPQEQLPMLRKLMKAMQNEDDFRILRNEEDAGIVMETLRTICA